MEAEVLSIVQGYQENDCDCHEVHTAIVHVTPHIPKTGEPAESRNVSQGNLVTLSCGSGKDELEQSTESTHDDDRHVVNEAVLNSGQDLV